MKAVYSSWFHPDLLHRSTAIDWTGGMEEQVAGVEKSCRQPWVRRRSREHAPDLMGEDLAPIDLIKIKSLLSPSSSSSLPVAMADWGPVLVAVVLFVLLSPGLLFQLPGHNRVVEFGSMRTSCPAVIVHGVIFFGILTLFLITIGVHVYAG
ncbi:hypothetical protein L2E82_27434 [Cichorium intybus]|uniref:Uncharacterized protein n=1 Tax=Cichorium intybus TaxID=13427 RepID=A0ACB9CT33_CICIN|nr:hypothetical protein L2E82_27434 [Cichorium intybus]